MMVLEFDQPIQSLPTFGEAYGNNGGGGSYDDLRRAGAVVPKKKGWSDATKQAITRIPSWSKMDIPMNRGIGCVNLRAPLNILLPSFSHCQLIVVSNGFIRGLGEDLKPLTFSFHDKWKSKKKIIRGQKGQFQLRGTNAGLALAIITVGIYLPCYDIFRNWFEEFATENAPSMTPYAPLLVGSLSRSV
ncbi:unnamed protein product [Lactuca saligna]|uniref:Uncharacterized protein n=1 Tax=Lactuca saligna TaxID=75948 RepID=A0AA35Y310_LACSI|nr:unnamed protein product [Lactuca saligna]